MNEQNKWPLLLGLQQRIFAARDVMEICFLAANETWHLIPYRQACVFLFDRVEKPKLTTVSGLAAGFEDTPFTLWVSRVCATLKNAATGQPQLLTAEQLPEELRSDWVEWWPAHALYAPLLTAAGQAVGAIIYVRDNPWTETETALLEILHRTYAYAVHALRPARRSFKEAWRRSRRRPWLWLPVLIALIGLLSLPVRLSVLAPAEIIALQSEVVAAPLDGVIKTFQVRPNQPVQTGQLLFSLDDTDLRNRREIAKQALEVARIDALTAERRAFDSPQSKSELAALQGHVQERTAELAYLDEALSRIDVRAAHAGVFVYGDPNDWIGKPVVTGERIGRLAQPDRLGVMVWVAVGDAIALEPGADIRVYLQTAPLKPLSAKLTETSYQASLSPENIAAYRIRGELPATGDLHIGLRGIAKVYGDRQPLAYWIMRRPLGALRQRAGL